MLASRNLIAFLAVRNADNARAFYRDKLGLPLVSEDRFALVFNANGTMLRVTPVGEIPTVRWTVLGWEVPDMEAAVRELRDSGIQFEQFGGMGQDEQGIWTAPTGDKVAWFKDPDGNTLSLSQHGAKL
jgi:catechol 2,3-dioxygenase-like lactoylglutathione lyase family enzyme